MSRGSNNVITNEFEKLIKYVWAEYIFNLVHDQSKSQNLKYKLQALRNSLKIIEMFPDKITSSDQLKNISGIGKGTLQRVDEILSNGKISFEENIYSKSDQKKIEGLMELLNVYGIGPVGVQKLATKYKIFSVDDLKKKSKDKSIKLSRSVLIGLKYYGKFNANIPRSHTEMVELLLKKVASQMNSDVIICGSYRRGKIFSSDFDVLLFNRQDSNILKDFISKLKNEKFIIDDITYKDIKTKYEGFCIYKNIIRRIDIRFVPFKSLAAAQLYFTGPGTFNVQMRKDAKRKGFKLNEYGLFKLSDGSEIFTQTEEDIFRILGIKYLKPSERN